MKIAILDDHELVRVGLKHVLTQAGHTVSIEAATAEQLFEALAAKQPCDILLLDLQLPGISGMDVAKRMRTDYAQIDVIILSVETRVYPIMQLMEIGIDGYVSKAAPLEELPLAIESVSEGVPYYGKDIALLIRDIVEAKGSSQLLVSLTRRELQIIEACCAGKLGKEIAEQLHISLRGVNSHKTNIFTKLGISSSVEMVRFALEYGII